jgi:hypothetical protein
MDMTVEKAIKIVTLVSGIIVAGLSLYSLLTEKD